MRTGNLAAVMKTMGHRDVKTAMHYQHPELDVVRVARITARQAKLLECSVAKKVTIPFTTHPKNHNLGKSLITPAIALEKKILRE
jgi:hypothetical protein